ncbi:MAG: hypothetical protein O7H41_01855 [Planctomycetota bacterium]|nr:hypothetical protein [Planctomycetota bacterium]
MANPLTVPFTVTGIRVHGEGDLEAVETLGLYLDADENSIVLPGETPLWSGGFGNAEAEAVNLRVEIPGQTAVTILLCGDLDPAAPDGATFRVSVDGANGDLITAPVHSGGEIVGLATSGRRTVGSTGTIVISPVMPRRGPFSSPGDTEVPAVAALVRASSVEEVRDLQLDIEGWGAIAGWSEFSWSLWLDGDGDGAVGSPSDLPVATGIGLRPGEPPRPVTLPDPLAAGESLRLVLAADIGMGAVDRGLFGGKVSLLGGTGASSGASVALGGDSVQSAIRVGTVGIIVAAGYGLSILDPDSDAPLAVLPGYWHADGGVVLDPQGRWAATATGCPGQVIVVDLLGLKEGGRIPLPAYPRSMVAAPSGDRVFVSLRSRRGVAELTINPDLSGGSVTRILVPGQAEGKMSIHPTEDHLYLAQETGQIQVIDASSGNLVRTLSGPPPASLDITADGSHLLVVSDTGGLAAVPVDGGPSQDTGLAGGLDIAVSPDGGEAYFLGPDSVQVLETAGFSVTEIRTFATPGRAVAAGARAGRAVVLDEGGHLFVLDRGSEAHRSLSGANVAAWAIDVVK